MGFCVQFRPKAHRFEPKSCARDGSAHGIYGTRHGDSGPGCRLSDAGLLARDLTPTPLTASSADLQRLWSSSGLPLLRYNTVLQRGQWSACNRPALPSLGFAPVTVGPAELVAYTRGPSHGSASADRINCHPRGDGSSPIVDFGERPLSTAG
ncbi:hypothetical protein BCV70DRAFT_230212 [Testicularia cyperi]|uniref:Uncharacterized protein n=1 Tax=Testicularia cyperi TaxID=1882483 RepID=A0A317XUI2_9BASI|nr:hypothetical protein BCV70DRAFT_230212 [Testicularia cyperi]